METLSNWFPSWRAWVAPALALVFFLVALSARDSTNLAQVSDGQYDGRGFKNIYIDGETRSAVRYNACRPVEYVINPAGAPPEAIEDVHAAFAMTSQASGMKFVYGGETTEHFAEDREPYQPDSYGDRWVPILIDWSSLAEGSTTNASEGTAAVGRGGSTFRANSDGQAVYVTGAATFDPATDLNPGFGGRTWGQVILHEIGHIVGLDHVDDEQSVMNPVVGLRPAAWGDGDRAGLWSLGMGSPCLRSPATP